MIPFHRPSYDQDDERALVDSLRRQAIVGDGMQTRAASLQLARMLGTKHVLLTTSCTHALELAMMVLRLSRGDEVIVPSFTFVSTPNSIMRQGARPVFVDITADTLTIDPLDVERKLSHATRAIIPVLYAGISPAMDSIMELAAPRRLAVVEDAAQGIGAAYRGKPAGTTGTIGCYSFHETKNYSTGEGGAFSTNSDALMSRAEIIREKGTNRKQFLQGLVDKYTWVDVGSSYLPPDTMAAMLITQLAKREQIQAAREAIYHRYVEELKPLSDSERITLPTIPEDVRSNHHIFHILLRDESVRNRALAFFREREIGTTFHYLPLHLSPVGRSLGYAPGDCPITESVSARLLRLPIYPGLSEPDQSRVIEALKEFLHT